MPLILAVDDSPSMRKMVSFTLTGAGYLVVEAVDGVDAYEKAQAQSFDLVLTDQNIPRLLMLTTESSDLMKQAGRAAGATGWLVKPFDPARLLEVIKKVIK
jgi:two-component system chemotaxis response regulator CheY